jgi:NAD(P)-dependent dehydrogenase (short-subunit alcohol dehydrogenase family)
MTTDFYINSYAPLLLYQTFSALLSASNAASPGSAKFVAISSALGQITEASAFPWNAYGASKSALNFLVKKINMEVPEVVAFPLQ